jgi:hypothetical protein
MLGLGRLQRRRMRRHREPAAQVHGRPAASACAGEHDQLPLVADAKVRHQPEEAKIKKERKKNM